MVYYLEGKVKVKNPNFLVLLVAGVGYKVSVSPAVISAAKVGVDLSLYIHQHVREDTLDLYGFLEESELGFFEMLLSISGVGPRSALSIIALGNIADIKQSIMSKDVSLITRAAGIGRKTAERIIIELKSKIGELPASGGNDLDLVDSNQDIFAALSSLGYSRSEIIGVVRKIPTDIKDNDERVKWAIRNVGKS